MKTTFFLLLTVVAVSVESRGCVPGSRILGKGGCVACVCKKEDTQFHCEDLKKCGFRKDMFDSQGCKLGAKIATKGYCKTCLCREDRRFECTMDPEKCKKNN